MTPRMASKTSLASPVNAPRLVLLALPQGQCSYLRLLQWPHPTLVPWGC
jgi:hypothetical protein